MLFFLQESLCKEKIMILCIPHLLHNFFDKGINKKREVEMRRGNKGNRDEKSKKERWKSRKKGENKGGN